MTSRQPDDTTDLAKAVAEDAAVSGASKKAGAPEKVDPWFDTQLMQLYSEIAEEPIPEDLLELVKKLQPPNQ